MAFKNKKEAPNACTIESGKERIHSITFNENLSSPEDNILVNKSKPGFIESLLPHGAENAIDREQLMSMTGIYPFRRLQVKIREERKNGALIASLGSGGFFVPAEGDKGREEMEHFVAMIYSKSLHTMEAAEPFIKALGILDGQIVMEDLLDNGEKQSG